MDELNKFLDTEIYQDMYREIMSFILSPHIRCGEFECNEYIIKKMDSLNYIIFREYDIVDHKEIINAFSIFRDKLISAINNKAASIGLSITPE